MRNELEKLAKRIRVETLKAVAGFGSGHLGGALSIADLLAVLYGKVMRFDPKDPKLSDRDWLVLSKGHCGPSLYASLAIMGFFPLDELMTLNKNGTRLPSHCDCQKTPGVDVTTGSLGQGASAAAGVALGMKLQGIERYVYLILGDGECNEGQVWEMLMFAAQNKLDNLIAFIDKNGQQLDGYTKDICDMDDLEEKFRAFRWHTTEIDGHDVMAIYDAICEAQKVKGVPSVIIMNTVKGKGCSLIEGTKNHHSTLTKEQAEEEISRLDCAGK